MPGAAAGLTDVRTGDPQPLVLGRRGQHPLQQLAVAGLELGPFPQPQPGLADPSRQRVADGLEIAEPEGARLVRHGGDAGVDPQAWEGLGEERAELRFQAPDLTPQLRTRQSLVAIDAKLSAYLSLKQIRHSPPTSVDQVVDPIETLALSTAPCRGRPTEVPNGR